MSLSKVIKLRPTAGQQDEVLPSPHRLFASEEESGFHSFESIWQKAAERAEREELEKSPVWQAEQQAAEIIGKAREEAGRIEKAAYDKGFASGEAKALAAGQQQNAAAASQFAALFAKLEGQRQAVFKQYEQELFALIQAMVDRLVNHEVSVNPRVIKACVIKAMGYVVENSSIKIRLHAEDFERIKAAGLNDPRFLESKGPVQLIDDPAVAMGGCLLETDFGQIDASLENCREALYKAVEEAFMTALAEGGEA